MSAPLSTAQADTTYFKLIDKHNARQPEAVEIDPSCIVLRNPRWVCPNHHHLRTKDMRASVAVFCQTIIDKDNDTICGKRMAVQEERIT